MVAPISVYINQISSGFVVGHHYFADPASEKKAIEASKLNSDFDYVFINVKGANVTGESHELARLSVYDGKLARRKIVS